MPNLLRRDIRSDIKTKRKVIWPKVPRRALGDLSFIFTTQERISNPVFSVILDSDKEGNIVAAQNAAILSVASRDIRGVSVAASKDPSRCLLWLCWPTSSPRRLPLTLTPCQSKFSCSNIPITNVVDSRLVTYLAPLLNKPVEKFNWVLQTEKPMSKVYYPINVTDIVVRPSLPILMP